MGVCLTILLTLTTLMFFITKVISIYAKHEVDIMDAMMDNALTFEDKFGASNGLFVAAALTEYDDNPEIIEVPEKYGELKIFHYGWGLGEGLFNNR